MKIIFTKHIEMIEKTNDGYEIHLSSGKVFYFSWGNVKRCALVGDNNIYTIEKYLSPLNEYYEQNK